MNQTSEVDAPVKMSARLTDFPWDQLGAYRSRAERHPDGLVNVSMGTPVDPVPPIIRAALAQASDSPGYPTTLGQLALREAIVGWMERRTGVVGFDPAQVLPLMGTKELLAWLPTLVEVPHDGIVVVPELAYPSYVAAAEIANVRTVHADTPDGVTDSSAVRLAYLNSPRNPTGRNSTPEELVAWVEWARANDVILVSDECYSEFVWTGTSMSILHPEICGGTFDHLLVVNSLSKRSNMAGYRAGFVAGDERLMSDLLTVRKHLGVAVPTPIQAAMIAALDDDEHVDRQRAVYGRRREVLMAAFKASGWTVEPCEGGLYLWVSRPNMDGWEAVGSLSELGILATPGDFYGPAGRLHVRVALTATDAQVDMAVARMNASHAFSN